MKPDKTLEIRLRTNTGGLTPESKRHLLIDTASFPAQPGAYVVRYATLLVPRMEGESGVLKIGKADKGIKARFENYNHMKPVTTGDENLLELLDRTKRQPTNVRLMHFLSRNQGKQMVIDCYFSTNAANPREREKQLLREYFNRHQELPPLNFGLR